MTRACLPTALPPTSGAATTTGSEDLDFHFAGSSNLFQTISAGPNRLRNTRKMPSERKEMKDHHREGRQPGESRRDRSHDRRDKSRKSHDSRDETRSSETQDSRHDRAHHSSQSNSKRYRETSGHRARHSDRDDRRSREEGSRSKRSRDERRKWSMKQEEKSSSGSRTSQDEVCPVPIPLAAPPETTRLDPEPDTGSQTRIAPPPVKVPQYTKTTAPSHPSLTSSTASSHSAANFVPTISTNSSRQRQEEKKKLLWGDTHTVTKPKQSPWQDLKFSDSGQTEKFRKLMGIRTEAGEAVESAGREADPLEKQEKIFRDLQKQFCAARSATHSSYRGSGLGFGSQP